MIFIKFTDGTVQTVDGDRLTCLLDQGVVAFVAVTQQKKRAEA